MNSLYIDSHLHLQDPAFFKDVSRVLLSAEKAGVSMLICNGTCEEDWPKVAELVRGNTAVLPCYGLHPWFVDGRSPEWLNDLKERLAAEPSGVGEIGLDRSRRGGEHSAQEEVFRAQLGLACSLDRPVTIHCVKAWGWLLDVLKDAELPSRGFLLHAYGGSPDLVPQFAKLGAWFSFAGSVTGEGNRSVREAARLVPVQRLLIESDSPDQTPSAEYAGYLAERKDGRVRNEPATLSLVLAALAKLRGDRAFTLGQMVFNNSKRFWAPMIAGFDPAQE